MKALPRIKTAPRLSMMQILTLLLVVFVMLKSQAGTSNLQKMLGKYESILTSIESLPSADNFIVKKNTDGSPHVYASDIENEVVMRAQAITVNWTQNSCELNLAGLQVAKVRAILNLNSDTSLRAQNLTGQLYLTQYERSCYLNKILPEAKQELLVATTASESSSALDARDNLIARIQMFLVGNGP